MVDEQAVERGLFVCHGSRDSLAPGWQEDCPLKVLGHTNGLAESPMLYFIGQTDKSNQLWEHRQA